jgi:GntR family transcriptional regulator
MSGDQGPNIPLRLSMDDPEPMYRQIEAQLRDFILTGQLPPGTKLPSVRALASDLACSVITTRRAYQDLEAAGFIRTRHGIGTTVASLDESQLSQHRRGPVEQAFSDAIEAGRRAGLSEDEIRGIFEETLHKGDQETEGDDQ